MQGTKKLRLSIYGATHKLGTAKSEAKSVVPHDSLFCSRSQRNIAFLVPLASKTNHLYGDATCEELKIGTGYRDCTCLVNQPLIKGTICFLQSRCGEGFSPLCHGYCSRPSSSEANNWLPPQDLNSIPASSWAFFGCMFTYRIW